jgi:ribosome biogenesis GTPase A
MPEDVDKALTENDIQKPIYSMGRVANKIYANLLFNLSYVETLKIKKIGSQPVLTERY